jgi:hypothetical protein
MTALHRPRRSPQAQTFAELERRRVDVQALIDTADIDTTTPAELNEWLATRMLIDRSISRYMQARMGPERTES